MASSQTPTSITPASLSYLAIFNPSLGPTDETLPNQIVFWTSRSPTSQNECLRQIGLAQGIIEFARGFSGEQDLNAVETQKSRVVLHEIEPGWWILASVDLTQIHYSTDPPSTDYSPREVAPASVLTSQLKTSHRQFLLFNSTLESILTNHGRDVLTQRLEKFYTRWAWRWEVMLNGNPAVDIWNGIKIGRGVGEEEKDLLGEFAVNNLKEDDGSECLVDLVVSRFGKLPGDEKDSKKTKTGFSTRGTGRIPGPDDGCIFRGLGNLKKESVRDIAEWMARWYQYGDSSFDYQTVRPSRKKLRRAKSKAPASNAPQPERSAAEASSAEILPSVSQAQANEPAASEASTSAAATTSTSQRETVLPPPLLLSGGEPNAQRSSAASDPKNKDKSKGKKKSTPTASASSPSGQTSSSKGSDNTLMLNVLTLGTYAAYSAWNKSREAQEASQTASQDQNSDPSSTESSGRFIIGYTGALDGDENDENSEPVPTDPKVEQKDFISTTVWVARNKFYPEDSTVESQNDIDKTSDLEECRLVAYAVSCSIHRQYVCG
ncbi:hypothetical protein TWF694_001673 [Orbilia ellipsospora]|uniref:CCZ1/INTU/HSP4 first Longin domain-containing protein n=1 Tax=Orbilia ellipsospora TaxID=2528407 RepID=A0AAV9X4E5_9PEZI